jgi:primosomal protein N'
MLIFKLDPNLTLGYPTVPVCDHCGRVLRHCHGCGNKLTLHVTSFGKERGEPPFLQCDRCGVRTFYCPGCGEAVHYGAGYR